MSQQNCHLCPISPHLAECTSLRAHSGDISHLVCKRPSVQRCLKATGTYGTWQAQPVTRVPLCSSLSKEKKRKRTHSDREKSIWWKIFTQVIIKTEEHRDPEDVTGTPKDSPDNPTGTLRALGQGTNKTQVLRSHTGETQIFTGGRLKDKTRQHKMKLEAERENRKMAINNCKQPKQFKLATALTTLSALPSVCSMPVFPFLLAREPDFIMDEECLFSFNVFWATSKITFCDKQTIMFF